MSDRTRGLFRKFLVTRTDGTSEAGQKHDGCEYFVLDMTHDPYAKAAASAYVDACKADYPLLAADMVRDFNLRADALAPPEPGWQPIETAPKDGRWFWTWRDTSGSRSQMNVSAFKWDGDERGWFAGTGWWPQFPKTFTHWREMKDQPEPLPAPPRADALDAPPEPEPTRKKELALPEVRPLTVVLYRDNGATLADEKLAAIRQGDTVIVNGVSELFFHQLRLRVTEDPTLHEKIAVFWSKDGTTLERVSGLRLSDELRWPVGFLNELWEKETEVRAARQAAEGRSRL